VVNFSWKEPLNDHIANILTPQGTRERPPCEGGS
jgi:hypothetical protein